MNHVSPSFLDHLLAETVTRATRYTSYTEFGIPFFRAADFAVDTPEKAAYSVNREVCVRRQLLTLGGILKGASQIRSCR